MYDACKSFVIAVIGGSVLVAALHFTPDRCRRAAAVAACPGGECRPCEQCECAGQCCGRCGCCCRKK